MNLENQVVVVDKRNWIKKLLNKGEYTYQLKKNMATYVGVEVSPDKWVLRLQSGGPDYSGVYDGIKFFLSQKIYEGYKIVVTIR